MHLVGFDTLFRCQDLVEFRGRFGPNRHQLSYEAALLGSKFLNLARALICLRRGRQLLTVQSQLGRMPTYA
jgi:hypothetical protein